MANTFVLISKSQLTSNTSSVTFSSIPQTYDNLQLIWSARSTQTADNMSTTYVTLNSGTAHIWLTMYEWQSATMYGDAGSGSTVYSAFIGAAGNGKPAGVYSVNTLELSQYKNTAYRRQLTNFAGCSNANSGSVGGILFSSSYYDLTTAITSIQLTDVAGQYMSGSNFYLYGIKNT